MTNFPIPIPQRPKPFETKKCARCGSKEFRTDGYCSIYCRDIAELEEELYRLQSGLHLINKWLANLAPYHSKNQIITAINHIYYDSLTANLSLLPHTNNPNPKAQHDETQETHMAQNTPRPDNRSKA